MPSILNHIDLEYNGINLVFITIVQCVIHRHKKLLSLIVFMDFLWFFSIAIDVPIFLFYMNFLATGSKYLFLKKI